MPQLSILVCSLADRLDKFDVIQNLCFRAKGLPVEVLWLGDNQRMTVGEKRNKLLQLSSGKYTCFVDDDDTVKPHYVSSIMEKIEGNIEAGIEADCICFNANITTNGASPMEVHYSFKYEKDEFKNGVYLRIPNHLMVINSKISKKIPFKHITKGEDAQWAKDIYPHLKIQTKIYDFLYHYQFNTNTTEAQKI